MIQRYVVVSTNAAEKTIIKGPILWDGEADLDLPDTQQAILESVALSGGYTYSPRPAFEVNAESLRDKAQIALTVNNAFLALATPTAAQNAQQVGRLTRQVNALIRLTMHSLDTTEGT